MHCSAQFANKKAGQVNGLEMYGKKSSSCASVFSPCCPPKSFTHCGFTTKGSHFSSTSFLRSVRCTVSASILRRRNAVVHSRHHANPLRVAARRSVRGCLCARVPCAPAPSPPACCVPSQAPDFSHKRHNIRKAEHPSSFMIHNIILQYVETRCDGTLGGWVEDL